MFSERGKFNKKLFSVGILLLAFFISPFVYEAAAQSIPTTFQKPQDGTLSSSDWNFLLGYQGTSVYTGSVPNGAFVNTTLPALMYGPLGINTVPVGARLRIMSGASDTKLMSLLSNAGTELFTVLNPSGNVGIGNTAPVYKLDVNGLSRTKSLNISDFVNSSGLVMTDNAGNLYSSTTAAVLTPLITTSGGWTANGTTVYKTDNAGNVGIGTTNPSQKLTLVGSASNPSLTHDSTAMFSIYPTTVGTDLVFGAMPGSPFTAWIQNRHKTLDGYVYPIALNPLGGNVGIGTTTPTEKLEVVGKLKIGNNTVSGENVTFDGSTSAGMRVANSSGYVSITPLNPGWAHIYTDRANFIFDKPIYSLTGKFSAYSTANLELQTSGATRMTIVASNGNVGIGTTNPTYKLEVNGNFRSSSANISGFVNSAGLVMADAFGTLYTNTNPVGSALLPSGTSGQTLRYNGTGWVANSALFNNGTNVGVGTTAPVGKLEIKQSTNDLNGGIRVSDSGIGAILRLWSDGTRGRIDVGATSQQNLIINSEGTGNVGIGTTNPLSKLEVAGAINGIDLVETRPNIVDSRFSSFENFPVGQVLCSITGRTGSVSSDYSLDGGYSFKLEGNAVDGSCNVNAALTMNVKPLTKYIMSYYVYRPSGSVARPQMYVKENGASGSYRGCTLTSAAVSSGQWVRCSSSFTTNADTTLLNLIRFDIDSDGATTETFYFDAVQIEEASSFATIASNYRAPSFNPWRDSAAGIQFQGNVGIGNTNPTYKLDVNGNFRSASANISGFVNSAGLVMADAAGSLYTNTNPVGSALLPSGTSGQTLRYNGTSWVANSALFNNGTNVGIGTTNPGAILQIEGGSNVVGGSGTNLRFSYGVDSQQSIRLAPGNGDLNFDRYYGGTWYQSLSILRSNGNVGIGTSTPVTTLDVVSSNASPLRVYRNSGNSSIQVQNDVTSAYFGLNNSDNISLGFSADQTNAPFQINSAGSVGIGNTNPTYKLDVNGNFRSASANISGFVNSAGLVMADASGTLYTNTNPVGSALLPSGTSGQTLRYNGTSWVANSNLFNNGTNVGIGTTVPNSDLEIANTTGAVLKLNTKDTDIQSGDILGNLIFSARHDGSSDGDPDKGKIRVEATGTYSGGPVDKSKMVFSLTNGAGVLSDHTTLLSNGNLGIGTSNPTAKLDVDGNIIARTAIQLDGQDASYATITNRAFSNTDWHGPRIANNRARGTLAAPAAVVSGDYLGWYDYMAYNGSAFTRSAQWIVAVEGAPVSGNIPSHFRFNTTDLSGTFGERMRITANGNLGVNNSNPSYKLDVNGNFRSASANISGFVNSAGLVMADASGSLYTNTNPVGTSLLPSGTSGQTLRYNGTGWVANSALFNNGTNVGIGTVSPISKFQITASSTDRIVISGDTVGNVNTNSPKLSFYGFNNDINLITGPSIQKINTSSYGRGRLAFFQHGGADYTSEYESMSIDFNGNVGINNVAPVSRLHVSQNDTSTGSSAGLTVEQLGTGDAIVQFLIPGQRRWVTGIDNSDGDKFKLSSSVDLNSETRLTIDTSGNVGVGTASPGQKLDVSGRVIVHNGGTAYNNAGSAELHVGYNLAAPSTSGSVTRLALQPYSHTGGPWRFDTRDEPSMAYMDIYYGSASTTGFSIRNNGNVGLSNQSPTYKLDVNGNFRSSSANISGFVNSAGLVMSDASGSLYTNTNPVGSALLPSGTSGQTLRYNGTSWVANSTLYNNGTNVGIGTVSPSSKLQITQLNGGFSLIVGADASADSITNATQKFTRIGMPHYTNAEEPFSLITGDSNATQNALSLGGGTTVGNSATLIKFLTSANNTTTSGTERMRITSNGNVGIGTTNPTEKLDVAGNIKLSGVLFGDTDSSRNLASNNIYTAGVTGYQHTNGRVLTSGTTNRIVFSRESVYTTNYSKVLSPGYYSVSFWYKVENYVSGSTININLNDLSVSSFDISSNKGWTFHSGTAYISNTSYGFLDMEGSFDSTVTISDLNIIRSAKPASQHSPSPEDMVQYSPNNNVGIGNTAPSYKLDVNGNFRSSSANISGFVNSAGLVMSDASGSLYTNTNPVGSALLPSGTSGQTLRYNGTSWVANSALFNNGTNVGVGTVAPGVKFEVANSARESSLSNLATMNIVGNAISARTDNSVQDILRLHQPNTAGTDSKGSTFAIGLSFPDDPNNNLPRTRVDFKTTGRTTDDADAGNTVMSLMDSGNVGIGTTAPSAKLDVNGDVKGNNFIGNLYNFDVRTNNPLPQDVNNSFTSWFSTQGTNYAPSGVGHASGFTVAGYSGLRNRWQMAGDATLTPNDFNKWYLRTGSGSAWGVWRQVITDDGAGNVGINTTNPGTKLDVNGTFRTNSLVTFSALNTAGVVMTDASGNLYATSSAAITGNFLPLTGGSLSGNLNMGGNNILNINKLTVNTIDPLYRIEGINYSTFASSIAGGVKEEYIGRAKIDKKKGSTYETVIDFNKVEKGSDLWVWRKTVDFSDQNVEVMFSVKDSFARVYYSISGNKIIFHSDIPSEISYRLVGNRIDWKEWPTRALDQEEIPGFIID